MIEGLTAGQNMIIYIVGVSAFFMVLSCVVLAFLSRNDYKQEWKKSVTEQDLKDAKEMAAFKAMTSSRKKNV